MIYSSPDARLAGLRMMEKILWLLPPEAAPTIDVTRNQEEGDGYLQCRCKGKCFCVVIVVSIVEGQGKQGALLSSLAGTFLRLIQCFQGGLKVEYAIVTAQVEQVLLQGPSLRTVITED